jgi:hypothetical protein
MSKYLCAFCGAKGPFFLVLKLGPDYNDRNRHHFVDYGIENWADFAGQVRQYEVREVREIWSKAWDYSVPIFVDARGQAASDEVPDPVEDGAYDPLWYCPACIEVAVEFHDLLEKVVGA